MEPTIITLELRGHGDSTPLVVNGDRWALGDSMRGRHGLDAVVDERLLRYVAVLALRRRSGMLEGWTTAEELGFLADHGGTGAAAAKFLERRLQSYPDRTGDDLRVSDAERMRGHLIMYRPRSTDRRQRQHDGVSRGPYRLGVKTNSLRFSDESAWSWLFPSVIVAGSGFDQSATTAELLEDAHRQFASGDILGARQLAAVGARVATAQLGFAPGDRDQRFLLASVLDLLSNLDMELGQPRSSLETASRAAQLFAVLRHPLGVAHAHQVRAHALGQMDDASSALAAARNSMVVLDNARAARMGAARAAYTGVLGQRLGKAGRHRQGERHLVFAARACEEAGLGAWAGIWSLRLCENQIATGELAQAEAHLERAHRLLSGVARTVPQDAVRARVTAQFLAMADRREEARRWAADAYRLGVVKGMANQIRQMLPIMASLGLDPTSA